MSTTSRRAKLIQSLSNKEERDAFVESNLETGIAFQIRANRLRRNMSQDDLAKLCDKKQPFIARMEGPSHGLPNIKTLLDLAAAFDMALECRFVPFSELVDRVIDLPGKDLSGPPFSEDARLSLVAPQARPETVAAQKGHRLERINTQGLYNIRGRTESRYSIHVFETEIFSRRSDRGKLKKVSN